MNSYSSWLVFAALCYAVMQCPSIYLSRSCSLSKQINISSIFFVSLSDSYTILVFPYQTSWEYSDRNLPQWGHRVQMGSAEIVILRQCLAPSCAVSGWSAKCSTLSCGGPWRVDDTSRGGVCWWRETTTKCMTSLNVMPKTTEQHLIVCSGKSEA